MTTYLSQLVRFAPDFKNLLLILVGTIGIGFRFGMVQLAQAASSSLPVPFVLGLQFNVTTSRLQADNRMVQAGPTGLGLAFGAELRWRLAPRYSFQTGLLLRTSTYNAQLDSFTYRYRNSIQTLTNPEYQYRLQSIEIPLLLRLGGLSEGSKESAPYGLFGFSTLLHYRIRARFGGQEVIGFQDHEFFSPHNESYRVTNVPGQIVDQDDRLRSVGLWIGIGGGWEWRLPADMSMSFGLRYDVPMSQLYMGDYARARVHGLQFTGHLTF